MSALLDDARRVVTDLGTDGPGAADVRAGVLAHLAAHGDAALGRELREHVTASALVLDASLTRALLCFHRKGRFWVQPGGHLDAGDADLLAAALRELREETGVTHARVPTTRAADLDRHALGDGFARCAWHLDVGFVVLADPADVVTVSDESTDVAWWPLDALPDEVPPGLGDRLARAARFAQAALPS
ncbi:NUDIX domain-containing protein [Cellulomonas sp. NS3]|uniref:NUDIX domain-containing protein n=1 Tax=Cellulomonas sp. NS3 TaxID=2973977 RepID=UPI0021626A49|nr:NUDIX domain-containing protein [Cellulomonas sp. NS3]